MTARVTIERNEQQTHVLALDGLGRFSPILDQAGRPIDLSDYDGRAGERPQFRTVSQALEHFERVQDLFARMV